MLITQMDQDQYRCEMHDSKELGIC